MQAMPRGQETVLIRPRRLVFRPCGIALLRMRELHYIAVGIHSKSKTTPEEAINLYSEMQVYSMAQLQNIPRVLIGPILRRYCAHVQFAKGFDGTEGYFLSVLQAARVQRLYGSIAASLTLWKRFGPPKELSIGLPWTAVLDILSSTCHQFSREDVISFMQTASDE